MKKTLAILALGALLGASSALAASKTFTFSAPASYADGGWEIRLSGDSPLGTPNSNWKAVTTMCAWDSVNLVSTDCQEVVESTATPPASIVTFANQRLANWRVAQGY